MSEHSTPTPGGMTRTLGVVSPDHPMFSAGPSFVFRNDPPEPAEDEVAPQADDGDDEDES